MEFKFNVPENETIARELMISYLNVGIAAAPEWSPFGKRTTDSSIEMDWGEESSKDILGNTYTKMKKPTMTQSFDPWDLSGGDKAQEKIANLAIVEQNAQALTNQDVMIAHFYLTESNSTAASFAERYKSCMVKPSGLGGEGGGNLGMPIDVTYGGERTVGTVTKSDDNTVTFTASSGGASEAYLEVDDI